MRNNAKGEWLADAASVAFTAVRDAHPDERFYFFALYTTPEGDDVCASAWSEEAYERVLAEHARTRPSSRVDARSLRFSAPDSPYHDGRALVARATRRSLHNACFAALARLDAEGFFGRDAARERVIINVVYGDMSDEQWLAHAERLNPAASIDAARPYLNLHVPSGRVSQWGKRAYQLTALSVSADRSIVAYTGSGGEVGVLRVREQTAIFERRRRDEHWASALTPKGGKLYIGDTSGVGLLDVAKGKYTPFIRASKPACLALADDGSLLAVSSWDDPLAVYSTATQEKVWEHGKAIRVSMAFSPCGRWLAVASTTVAERQWFASVTCLDAASGSVHWSASLGTGGSVRLGWSPASKLIVATAQMSPLADNDETTLSFFDTDGSPIHTVRIDCSVGALAVSPSGHRIALCARSTLIVIDDTGVEVARGTGTQEDLTACVFTSEEQVLAVGRDVNSGPAILQLTVSAT